jgi:hypothetical protein
VFANPVAPPRVLPSRDIIRFLRLITSPAAQREAKRLPLSAVAGLCGVSRLALYRIMWCGRVSVDMAAALTPIVRAFEAGKLRCNEWARRTAGRSSSHRAWWCWRLDRLKSKLGVKRYGMSGDTLPIRCGEIGSEGAMFARRLRRPKVGAGGQQRAATQIARSSPAGLHIRFWSVGAPVGRRRSADAPKAISAFIGPAIKSKNRPATSRRSLARRQYHRACLYGEPARRRRIPWVAMTETTDAAEGSRDTAGSCRCRGEMNAASLPQPWSDHEAIS